MILVISVLILVIFMQETLVVVLKFEVNKPRVRKDQKSSAGFKRGSSSSNLSEAALRQIKQDNFFHVFYL